MGWNHQLGYDPPEIVAFLHENVRFTDITLGYKLVIQKFWTNKNPGRS